MTIAGRVGLSLLAAVLLAASGIILASIVARVNQSAADTLDLRSSVLQASGDQLGLWHDEAKTDPVTSLEFSKLQLQPPLRTIGPDMPKATVFVENKTTGDLYLVQPCGAIESPPGTVIGTMDAVVHTLGGDVLGNICDLPATVGIASGDTVRAELRIDLAPGLASGDYPFQTMFDAASQVSTQPPAGMVGWWPGDGNANDIVGGNHGTLENGTTFATGKVGEAFSLDGVDDYVSAPFTYEGPFTVDFWLKADVASQAVYTSAFASSTPGNYNPFFQIDFDLSGNYRFHGGNDDLHVNIGPATTGSQHVGVTYDGSTVTTYLNGEFQNSAIWAGPTLRFETAKIGMNRDNAKSFGGLIDEVEIFNRALGAAEIRAIYNAGSAGKIKPQPIPPPGGMVSWWPGDGNTDDIAGDNLGVLQGGATYAPGIVDQAFSLDGVDDFVEAAQVTNLDGPSFTGLTIDAWIRPDTVAAGHAVAGAYNSSVTKTTYYLVIDGGKLNFSASWDPNWTVDFFVATSSSDIPVGQWTHVAGTWSGGNDVKLYIDGVEDMGAIVNAPNVFATLGDTNVPIKIGALTNISNELGSFFDGLIDEVEIFNRALTAGEIRAIYNAGSAGKIKP